MKNKMKITKPIFLVIVILMYKYGFSQEYFGSPKSNEKSLGIITLTTKEKQLNQDYSKQELYVLLLEKAQSQYPGRSVDIREMKMDRQKREKIGSDYGYDPKTQSFYSNTIVEGYYYHYILTGKVVYTDYQSSISNTRQSSTNTPKPKANPLTQALTKALINIREGSRLALDQIRTVNGDKEDFKDQIVEILLDEGFKVVAKEYLDRLYEEQQAQQSGIYNDRTTVQENNFSAVGYYINVKRTDSSIKVQIINVSTGEYEANTSVNLD